MKIICILLPHFPLRCELAKNPEAGNALIIACGDGAQKRVMDYSPELTGLEAGMPVRQALGFYEDAEVINADLAGYQSTFNAVMDCLQNKSPLLEGAELGVIHTSMEGMQLIYPDEAAFIHALKEAVPPAFEARFGIAEGKFPAWLAAVSSQPREYKSLTGDAGSFIKNTPCSCLPVSEKNKSALAAFGLKTLGQAAAMPPGPLEAQFGPEGKRIWELANGVDSEPLNPRPTHEVIEESLELACVAVSLDVLMLAIESMLGHTLKRLSPKGMGVICLDVWTHTINHRYWQKTIHFKQPANAIRSALLRISHVMEACPQPGPVVEIGIKVTGASCLAGRQKSLLPEVRSKDHFLSQLRQLEFKLGSPQVFKFKEVEPWSRIPERRHVLAPLNR